MLARHYRGISKAGGLFHDGVVTQADWGGALRRNLLVLYRKHSPPKRRRARRNKTANKMANKLANKAAEKGREDELQHFQSHAPPPGTGVSQWTAMRPNMPTHITTKAQNPSPSSRVTRSELGSATSAPKHARRRVQRMRLQPRRRKRQKLSTRTS